MAARTPRTQKAKSHEANEQFVRALRSGAYTALRVVRQGRQCHLVMRCGHVERIFVNRKGNRPDYHHAWQIREWLLADFGIPTDALPVEVES